MAGAPSTARPSAWSEQGRATGPALLVLDVWGVDGAPVNRSAFGVRDRVSSPLPNRPGGDLRGVAGQGRV